MTSDDIPIPSSPILFLDYDGTLAPIVPDPTRAFPHPAAPGLLVELEQRHPLYIVTGRHLKALESFIDEPYPAIGLHGMQEGTIHGDVTDLISDEARAALDRMRHSVPNLTGIVVEPKGPTFAVHYRDAVDEEAALEALEIWVEPLPSVLDVIRGKKVYEVRPRGVSKGTAVRSLMERHPGRVPVYIGDDTTDEDAFEALVDVPDAVTIRVGGGETAARYHLGGPDDVVEYLSRYLVA